MCNWEPGSAAGSPDRVAALVWALTELVVEPSNDGALRYLKAQASEAEPKQEAC